MKREFMKMIKINPLNRNILIYLFLLSGLGITALVIHNDFKQPVQGYTTKMFDFRKEYNLAGKELNFQTEGPLFFQYHKTLFGHLNLVLLGKMTEEAYEYFSGLNKVKLIIPSNAVPICKISRNRFPPELLRDLSLNIKTFEGEPYLYWNSTTETDMHDITFRTREYLVKVNILLPTKTFVMRVNSAR